MRFIHFTEVVIERSLSENVDIVTVRSEIVDMPPKRMIHKKMTPEMSPGDMVVEADRYLALTRCKYAPKVRGATGDRETGECRGLLIQEIEGRTLGEIPLMYPLMRLQVTIKLLAAMVAFEGEEEPRGKAGVPTRPQT